MSWQVYALEYTRDISILAWNIQQAFTNNKLWNLTVPSAEILPVALKQAEKDSKLQVKPVRKRSRNNNLIPLYGQEAALANEVALPFNLTFDGTEGGLADKTGVAGTGFTMVDPYSGTRSIADGTATDPSRPSYEPSKLTVADGKLSIVSNKGIAFNTNNNQINALGVAIPAMGKLTLETTLINPYNGANSEQGGLWFGLNDKNYFKLSITGNKIEMRREVADVSNTAASSDLTNPDLRVTTVISGLNTQTVRLRMVVDLLNGKLEGFYSTDGVTYLNAGARYTTTTNPSYINIASMEFAGKATYGGIYSTYRNATITAPAVPPTFTFDNFSVSREAILLPLVTAPYRINAGGIQRSVSGDVYSADTYYALIPGEVSATNYSMTGVSVPELYYERRFGVNIGYKIPIATGKYIVKLHMVENFHSAANSRLFDVALEGSTVLDDLDLYVAGGNKNKVVVTRSFDVEITDDALNIDFAASKDKAIINAIEILPAIVNTAPVFASSSYTFSKDENASIGTEIGTVSATDGENNTLTYTFTAGNEAGKFAINAGSGLITVAGALDYAVASTYTLTVQATDNGNPVQAATAQVTISVNDVVPANNAPVVANVISSKIATVGTAFTFEVPAATFSDLDNDPLALTATLANGDALPTWLSFNGSIFSGTPESAANYAIKVTANDGNASISTVFNLSVEAAAPINQAPVFASSAYTFNQDKSAPVNAIIGSVKATDAVDQTIVYSINAGNEAAKFAIDAVSGEIKLIAGLQDASTTAYNLTVQAIDNGSPILSATTQVTINITEQVPGNTVPVVANLISNKTGIVGTAFSFKVPANTFTDSNNDALTLTATLTNGNPLPTWLNFDGSNFSGIPESATTYSIKVTANDGQASVTTEFNLTVEAVVPVNQTPVFASSAYSFSKDENASVGVEIGTVSATDAENNAIAYSITAGNEAGKFAINPGSGVITLVSALDYAVASSYTLTVQATDNGTPVQSATTQVSISVNDLVPANTVPVVAHVISAKTITVGSAFSFEIPATAFSDADNDPLTLTATLANGSALPTWLNFNGSLFSGTPVSASNYSIKLIASDGKASVSTVFNLSIEATPVAGCPPNSTLPCNQLAVVLPFSITFNGAEGGLVDKDGKGTGFTMADAFTGTRVIADGVASSEIRGYEPSKLSIANGKLAIATNKGISIVGNNNQINGLGVEFSTGTNHFMIETTLVNPFRGSNDEQGGLWYGLNDKSFVRLAINNNRVVLRKELNDQSPITADLTDPSRRNTSAISNLDKEIVRLRLVVDPTANTVEGFYSVNGTTYINVGEGYPEKGLSIAGMGLTGNKVYAGIFGTLRNGTSPVTYNFENFSIAPQTTPTNEAPVVATVISDKTTTTGSIFNFAVPANTFSDADNNPLTLIATLTNGNVLPAWLSFNATTNTFNGTPVSTAIYPIKVTASDGQATVSTEFTLTVQAANEAPRVVSAPETQTITAGQPFSFLTGSFSDPNAGDVLTYSASLANNSDLPTWLQFDANTQTFSGTAPVIATSIVVRITATDKALAAANASFTINVEAAPVVVPCSPISTLPCEQINVPLPFVLNFDGTEGGLIDKNSAQTGFTMVEAYSGTRLAVDGTSSTAVTGYEPSRLTVANGRLSVQTNKGISFLANNNQVNTLGVGVLANGKLTLETTIVNPFNGSNSEQAGLWLGLNDKTFVKLDVSGNKIEMRRELNDVSSTDATNNGLNNPDQRILLTAISGLNSQTVRLRLVVDLVNNKLEGFYSTDGITYLNVGARYATPSLDIANLTLAGKVAYAGIFATYRNAANPVTFTFENFALTKENATGKMLAFAPNALDFTAIQGQAVATKLAVLAASEGSPAVTFTSTPASWLTLPAATLGNVAFGANNFSSTLAPGIYEATVTATAQGYEPATLLINLTINSPVAAQEIKVNFQDPVTVPPTGWIKDYGQPFGLKTGTNQGTNLEYGWRRRSDGSLLDLSVGGTTPGNGRKRTTPADVLQATLMHMQANTIDGTFNGTKIEGYWEIKVPNGSYDVTVSAGDSDPGTVPESHTLNVEGVNAFSNFVPTGTAGTATRFKSAKVRVTVADGFLTINADGGINTKINSALITPISVAPYLIWSASDHSLVIERGTTETNKTFSLDLGNSADLDNLPIALTATYGAGATNWLSFDATHNSSEPNVTFDYTTAKALAVGTYTATITAAATGYTPASTLIQITVLAPGSNQPYVISSTPANGAVNVSVNTSSIAANSLYVPEVAGFKGGVDNSTLTVNTVKVLKISGTTTTEIQGVVQGTGGGDAISFSPAFALEPNTKYRFVITNQVKSHSGAAFLPYEATFTTGGTTAGTPNPVAAEFAPKQVIPGTVGKKYTCLTFGPDGKFYALRLDGVIERFNIDRTTGMLSGVVEIKSLTNKYGLRSSVGLTFAPNATATNLIAYVSHCSAGLTNAPEFDGNISRLSGPDLATEELILTKLPRSKADHLVNSIAFGPDGALYFNQGSLSSMGSYDGTWQRDESLLAATVLRLDLSKLSGLTLPLDVRTTANQALINNAPTDNIRLSDGTYNPYATNSPLTIYASGVRNAVDLVWHSNGQLYVPANGSAAGGNSPASIAGTRRPNGTFYNGPVVPATTGVKVQNDWLFRINPLKPVGYYGHPNPLRGEYVANRGYLDNPKYATTQGPDANYRGAAYNFELNKSPNGAIEYKSNAFGGALKGRILVCRFSGGSDIIVLEPGSMAKDPAVNSADSDDKIYDIIGAQTGSGTNGITGLSGFTNPLDITEDVETGNLYVIEYNWNNTAGKTAQIVLLKATAPSAQVGIASVSPSEIVDNDVVGGSAGKNHTITIANTGNSNLTVTGITLDGVDKAQFQVVGAPTPSVAAPVTVARGSAITFNVAFNPTTTGVKTASLLVSSTNNPVKEVKLNGLGTIGLSGTNEPSLQAVLDVHGINVNVGDDNRSTNIIHSTNFKAALLGEEVSIQAFQRATDGLVLIEPLSVFGPQDPSGIVTAFGWYTTGNANDKNELFTVDNSNYQTVDVQTAGSLSFDPGITSFGFYSRWPFFANRHLYSEDALNNFTGAVPHHVRVYPLKDAEGTVIENSYVIATEEHISGYDYQDIAVIVRNVKPFGQVVAKQLTFASPSLAFAFTPGTTTAPQTVILSASTGTPALTITKSASSNWLTLPTAALGSLTFSINEAGLLPGTYNATVTVSADGYTSATLPVSLTVNNPVSAATIAASSEELVFDGLKNTTVTKRLTITNTGTSALNLGNLAISGANASNFSVQAITVEGEPIGNSLAPEETKTLQVTFAPGNLSVVSTFNAALTINSNAVNTPALSVGLYAMSLNAYEGNNEPPLQTVVNTLGYNINVGWTGLAGGIQSTLKGEEVAVQFFEKAGDGAVTITPVARYSPNQELPFGYYTKTNNTPVRSSVGTLSGVFGQHNALYPQIVAGSDQFNPATAAFGIYVVGLENRISYTEDLLNAGAPAVHAVRTYPLKNRKGELVPNSYLVCFEDASNGDYQDYMFVLRNVVAAGTRKTLAFNTSTLNYTAPVNGTAAAKTITLEALNGTPTVITLTKSANSNWLILPTAAVGNLSFGINTAGLTAGVYTTTVTASASGFTNSVMTVNLRIGDASANAIKINFQVATTATATTPAGYAVDAGLLYNDTRGYGWINPTTKEPKDHTASMRERTSANADLRLKTLALMQGTAPQTPGAWELKVTNGQYNVTVGAGDNDFFDSNHRINVEGVTAINNFVPTAQVPHQIVTTTVTVTDGKLTIDANGGTNTKITFVIVDPATAESDFLPPMATVQLKGTLQATGVYRNQVIATVNATDAGGSNLAQVQYSLNNEPYKEYYAPILVNTPGSYTLRGKAIDGNKNETITNAITFTVVQPEPSNANMLVENLDKFPANDRLVASLIQTPWRRENEDGTFTPFNRNHDVVKMRISNKGTGALTINGLTLSNPTGWKVAKVNNVDYDPITAAPITVNAGSSVEVSVQFIAQFTSGRIRILNDTLQIATNDDLSPKKKIVLHGMWQARGEGSNEPHAQEIIRAFGFKSTVGFNTNDGTNTGNTLVLNTDEILSSFFTRADASKPVYVVQMGAYHGCCAATESFQYYTKGSTSNATVFTHHPLDGQSLLPLRNGTAGTIAEGNFNPTGSFGFKISGSYSDRTRNSEGKIGMRVWKAIDANGNIIPNAYIIGHDYIGNPDVTNYDYQDNVFYVSNIKPETGSLNYSELAATPSAVDFGSRQIGAALTRTVELKNLGQTYANGTTDPVVTIKSVEIVGANLNEFAVAAPAVTTLAPQATTNLTVTFRSNSQGIKNAALLVHYNNGLSPLRIPLYGIADDNCNLITAVKRIKGGADANVTINGKVWEADRTYRAGSVQLDRPAVTPIAGTDEDALYQTYLSAAADLGETRYSVPLANGNYMVRMHFVENFFTAEGSRVFGIKLENQTRQSNLDIFREAGYKAALVKDFVVNITDGKLDVTFNPSVNRVALAGMEVFAASANPNAVTLTQQTVVGAECGVANGSITFGVSNSTVGSYLYKLGPNGTYQTSPVFTNLTAGSFTFYVKENVSNGCETAKVFTIPERNNLAFIVNAPVMTCTAASGTATVSNITGGTGNYTITWSTTPAQTGATATNLQPGVYTVTVLDVSGCSRTQQVTVTREQNCPVASGIRINAAGGAFLASNNRQFIADQYFGGTNTVSSIASGDILNTTDDELYRNERSAAAFTYSIPVTNGPVNVVLHFAEIWFTGAAGRGPAGNGNRMFNVDVEGSRKLTNYDIFAKAGGGMRAVQETIPVTVTDGILNINFTTGTANQPTISAIEVLSVTPTNVAPVLAAIGNKTVNVNQALTFTATATDANANQTRAFSLVGQPTGATINASTGAFTWTPATAGTYTFTVRVTDNGTPAMMDDEQITVTVNNVVAGNGIRINAGGAAYLATNNRQFIADQYFGGTAGTSSIASGDILNTTDDVLYRTERSSAAFTYSIPVQNGQVNVVLHFAEIWFGVSGRGAGGVGSRQFNVDVEGSRKLTNYDVFAKAGGSLRAIQETIPVTITDGVLNINFTSGAANLPKVSAIEVLPITTTNVAPVLAAIGNKTVNVNQALTFTATATDANANQTRAFSLVGQPTGATINASTGAFTWTPATAGTYTFTVRVTDNGTPAMMDDEQITVTVNNVVAANAIRINAGGTAYLASGNRQFIADQYFGGMNRTFSIASGDILNTTDDVMYRNERSAASFNYNIPVSNGTYNVMLHFVEIYHTAAGRRQFNVDVEGSRKFTNYDVYAKAGGGMRLVQETIPVTITDGVLNINFMSGSVDMPTISAIEVLPQTTTRLATTVAGSVRESGVGELVTSVLTVYPNPNPGDQTNVEGSNFMANEEVTILLYDAQGSVIQKEKATTNADGDLRTNLVFTKRLSSGVYMITAISRSNKVSTRLVVR
ncbi:malectin domain-containing carbohydrate-binding protein [Adhaeribacter pallidiroseus]|uniref:malectin domain-containing carbohydrate-binding protein n=1 Tax=Adhaeribacter pallidiroseus TaxID=2072847 RepID=UPI001EEF75E5|nr:malectin domain-containing carbohydrate-binding protein [Adhaeribacter pallidiroseus]